MNDKKVRYMLPCFFMVPEIIYFAMKQLLKVDQLPDDEANIILDIIKIVSSTTLLIIMALIFKKDIIKSVSAPKENKYTQFIFLGFSLLLVTSFTLHSVYYLISIVNPDYVIGIFTSDEKTLVDMSHPDVILDYSLYFLSLVVLAPIVEEIFFRGFLLERLSLKYGFYFSIAFGSLLFSILHTDILGAFIFSIFLCVVKVHTKSLYGPILIHASHNLFLFITVLSYELFSPSYEEDLDSSSILDYFYDESYYMILIGMLGFIAPIIYLRKIKNKDTLFSDLKTVS